MFVLGRPFQSSLMFVDKARSLPKQCFNLVGSGLTHKHKTRLEMFDRDGHSNLLQIYVKYGRKIFKTLGLDVVFTTLYYLRNLCKGPIS